MTVRHRIMGAFVLGAMLLLAFMVLFVPRRLAREHGEHLQTTATTLIVVLRGELEDGKVAKDTFAASLRRMEEAPDVAGITLFGPDGEAILHVGERLEAIESMNTSGHAVYVDDGYVAVQDSVSSAEGTGALRVIMSRAGFAARMKDFRSTQLLVGTVILLVGLLMGLIMSRAVVRPIEELIAGVKALERGDARTVEVTGAKELVELAAAINRMRSDLSTSYKELARAAKKARVRADKLERANVDLDSFAYAASHDLRAPLRGVAHLSEFITEDIEGVEGISPETRDNLALLRRRVQRLDNLLMSLLEYSRVGRVDDEPEDVDVEQLVREVVDLLAVPESFDVQIDDLPVITTPRAPLQRVFVHLIGNAIKHHDREEGTVHIGHSMTAQYEVFTVTDDGPGIPPELQEKAFKIFATLKRRDEIEGSGMGLALIKKIVESVGGQLNLESKGRGCRFIVRWPLDMEDEDKSVIMRLGSA